MIAFALANWRLVAIGALAVALAFQTLRLQHVANAFELYRISVEAAGAAAQRAARETDERNRIVKGELENEIKRQQAARARERAERSERFGALYRKYHGLLNADPGGSRVPEARAGAAVAVPDTGERVCFDRAKFAGGVRQSLGELYAEVEPLVRRGEDGVDAGIHWGRWARLAGVCQKEQP